MAVSKRRFTRGVSKSGVKNQVWVSTVVLDVLFDDTPAIEFNIVQGSDWEVSGQAEVATVLRIRGWLAVRSIQNSVFASWFSAMYKTDEDTGVSSPTGLGLYTDESVLWTDGGGASDYTIDPNQHHEYCRIDVKAMRKVTNGEQIRMTFASNVTRVHGVSGVFRALVRRGG